mmetsp:Transcript_47847/g.120463  ORF Transcript_47847/g.120463 Transcript_47847/m.120463 type:complete len:248 (-) Transcript_47847:286-1029(-)
MVSCKDFSKEPDSSPSSTMDATSGLAPPPLKNTPSTLMVRIMSADACSHPRRRPGAISLENEPMEMTRPLASGVLCSSKKKVFRLLRSCESSNVSSVYGSSHTMWKLCWWASRSRCWRRSGDMHTPVGLWKLGIVYTARGRRSSTISLRSRSFTIMPSSSISMPMQSKPMSSKMRFAKKYVGSSQTMTGVCGGVPEACARASALAASTRHTSDRAWELPLVVMSCDASTGNWYFPVKYLASATRKLS